MTPELRAEIIEMRKTPLLYQHLSSSIAPYIYGHDDIKKGLLLMLMVRNLWKFQFVVIPIQ